MDDHTQVIDYHGIKLILQTLIGSLPIYFWK